ncbi:MAG TPA: 4-alpha-glucanotransferase [Stellaceae bacterium]|jgi:4-alpha-glucanotransferase|nr:4-alpha-glucanotransferase [Stellaceae bacterium]
MSRLDELRRVAGLVGITLGHHDALGVWHEPGEEALSRLIAALGLPEEPEAAAAALAAEGESMPFGAPPLHIVPAEDPNPSLALRRPAGAAEVAWELCQEDGAHAGGICHGDILALPAGMPPGYHRLELMAGAATATTMLAVAPASAYLPPEFDDGARVWGLTTQLYGLRGAGNWGIGDFSDLGRLAATAGGLGAAALGLNPLHALFAAEPRHVSPYSPSTRSWLDYLYIDVTAVPGFAAKDAPAAAALRAARAGDEVGHAAVAALKRPVLEKLFRRLRRAKASEGALHAFRQFQQEGGAGLARFAIFEALHEHYYGREGRFSWHDWPEPMRDPNSAAVAEFGREHAARVEFFEFLQWQADRQLGLAAAAGQASGLSVGLYRDAAVGVNPHGAAAWADQELLSPGAAIGAPPDPLSRAGQDWGLAPINPLVLRRRGFAPFIETLRANMRHAGVLRIDHVMSLQRLYWIPRGMDGRAGAYVAYPFWELVRLVALESHRHRCAVIGEDLGTVLAGFRETLRAANILSYRVVNFERRWDTGGGYIPPGEYPPLAAASAATHDLPSLKGFWLGRDIEWRRRLDLYPDEAAEATETGERGRDRRLLLEALAHEGLVGWDRFAEFLPDGGAPVYTDELGDAIHAFLARSRARLMLVQIEDVVGEAEQANLPGTTDAHPNWRRRMTRTLEDVLSGAELARVAGLVGRERGWLAKRDG